MNEQHKNEPNKTIAPAKSGSMPRDPNEHPAKKPVDGAGKPGDPVTKADLSKTAGKSPANPDDKPAHAKT